MAVINHEKMEIEPFILDSVLEIQIQETLNEHTTFYLLARLEKDQRDKPVSAVAEGTKIKFKSDGNVIFSGVAKSINVVCVDEVYYLRAAAVSNTVLIDVEKKRRSFQDGDMKYRSIVGTITKSKKSAVTFGDEKAANKTIENIVLQYDETDWEFSKRLASHSNAVLIPVAEEDTPNFIFGIKDGGSKGSLEKYDYSVHKNLSAYRQMSQFPDLGFTEDDAVTYTVTADNYMFNLGDMLTLDGSPLYVSAVNFTFLDSVLKCSYTLSTKTAASAPKMFNRVGIIGLHLQGTVMDVKEDTVQVRLDIDEADTVDNGQNSGGSYWFKYATPYSAENHTGWYVMPELEDVVQVLFPTEDEKYAYAAAAVRQDEGGEAKMSDHQTKYLRTPNGKEIKLDEKEILITAEDDTTFIRINEDGGIDIITPHPINVTSNSTISMTSEDDFSITTKKNLIITADESILMSAKDNSSLISMENKAAGITVNSKPPIKISGDKTIDMTSKDKFTIKASKDLTASSDAKIIESGKSAIEMSTGMGSSIKMAGDIDIKAKLIKEN